MKRDSGSMMQILEVIGILEKIPFKFNDAKDGLARLDSEKYNKNIESAVFDLERATLKSRLILNNSLKKIKANYKLREINNRVQREIYGIKINVENDDIMHISMPITLPHYKQKEGYKSILSVPLDNALKAYQNANKLPTYASVVVAVINNIAKPVRPGFVRDNDNYDYKQIINTVCFRLLPDDNYKCCNVFSGVHFGDQDSTEIYIVPTDKFSDWFASNQEEVLS